MNQSAAATNSDVGYERSLAAERKKYDDCLEVHDLPPIFHYWSIEHIRPKLTPFGFDSANDMFAAYLKKQLQASNKHIKKIVSLGAGNCDLEISLARQLKGEDFVFECCDLNPVMLERGRAAAEAIGLGDSFRFVECDLNSWQPAADYDAVLANQSLHHIVNLEGVFAEVKRSLRPDGSFLISDMIGRNGHQRWPEALTVVREFWRKLPPSYRYNRVLRRYEEAFQDWDCSVQGFEGVRSQDILPLLIDYFHFSLFVPFGNVIDPFVDRSFGFNFDGSTAWDREFIDQVHGRDEREIASGNLTPTHLVAVAGKNPSVPCAHPAGLTPEFCVRKPLTVAFTGATCFEAPEAVPDPEASPYRWQEIPHDRQRELELACNRLAEAHNVIREHVQWGQRLENQLLQRTDWALNLEKELRETIVWAQSLEQQAAERASWAIRTNQELDRCREVCAGLQSQLGTGTGWAAELQAEVEDRTRWALELEKQLAEKCAWSKRLQSDLEEQTGRRMSAEREFAGCVRNPFRLLIHIARGAAKRLRGIR